MNNEHIKNVILDLGGVLFNIDPHKTEEMFANDIPGIQNNWGELMPILFTMEVGGMTDAEFYTKIKAMSTKPLSESFITEAWNKMIIDFPVQRIEMVHKLKERYNLYVLSNTNTLHINYFETLFYNKFGFMFQSMFDQVFYSSDIHLRKPNVEAFQYVLDHTGAKATETIMVDDLADNCAGAAETGMKAIRVPIGTGLEAVIGQLL